MSDFSEWLFEELNRRDWTYAQLAKAGGISRASISLIISGDRQPGPKVAQGIARAFGYPAEDVMRRAGLLLDKPAEDTTMNEWMAAGRQLTDEERAELLEWAFAKLSRRQR